jgi:hypothetical protein
VVTTTAAVTAANRRFMAGVSSKVTAAVVADLVKEERLNGEAPDNG